MPKSQQPIDDSAKWQEYSQLIEELADAAASVTLSYFRTTLSAQDKNAHHALGLEGVFDPVTEADREAERVMRALISARFPHHGILGEEFPEKLAQAASGEAPMRWVLDPIDGTRAFMCGLPSWTTLVAPERGGHPVLGLIDQPFTGERWLGLPERSEYVRKHPSIRSPLQVRSCGDLKMAHLSTTDPRAGQYFNDAEAEAFHRLAQTARVARFGWDAYAYAMLSMGHIDAVIEAGTGRYDVAALIPVVTGAGGIVTDWTGNVMSDGGRVVAAADKALHAHLVQELSSIP